jgi:hypothetical protein
MNQQQAQLEAEQNMSAMEATTAAENDIRQHGLAVQQQAFEQQAQQVQKQIEMQQGQQQHAQELQQNAQQHAQGLQQADQQHQQQMAQMQQQQEQQPQTPEGQ